MSFNRIQNGFTQLPRVNIPADPRLEALKASIGALKGTLDDSNHTPAQNLVLGQIMLLQRTAEHVRRELLGVTR